MAIFQVATNTPPKSEIIAGWICDQPWGPASNEIELVGSFHLDDPEGRVGMQVFVVQTVDGLMQVPLTYRGSPVPELAHALIATMEHSALGTRYVYDAVFDDRFVMVLAGVAVCGYGQALGFAEHNGRWFAVPDEMLVQGTGSMSGRLAVDGFEHMQSTDQAVVLQNDGVELTIFRRLHDRPAPAIGLTATWRGQADPVVLVAALEIEAR